MRTSFPSTDTQKLTHKLLSLLCVYVERGKGMSHTERQTDRQTETETETKRDRQQHSETISDRQRLAQAD